ncbi:MAG: phytoene/squalene synthase family protein [Anaerolineales bacterium]|nr:MAG: phytoene/squalene synthase family protein [Anaerolineales bacterium]
MDAQYKLGQVATLQTLDRNHRLASARDYAECRRIMRAASKNYSSASNYLPADKLPHVEALYALMRVGDDRVDVSHKGFKSAEQAIDDWEHTYWQAFEHGDSPHAVMRAYLDTAVKFKIPIETMAAYFRAMREDLHITRFPTFNDLKHYMEGSAIPVGRAMTHILGTAPGYSLEEALPGADSLSIAMQLSNFWRDIGEDWRIGRVYLPQEDMKLFDYPESDLADKKVNARLKALLEHQFERTERYYEHARAHIKMLGNGQWAIMSALEIYKAILTNIRANNYDVFDYRAGTSRWQKASLAVRAYWQVRWN